MEYTILIHQAEEGGFWSEAPLLPGCYSQGETIDETMRSAKEAIEAHLMALKEDGVTAPVLGATEQYVVDANVQKIAVILPLAEYERLQEDLHDLSVIATRKEEASISLEELKTRL